MKNLSKLFRKAILLKRLSYVWQITKAHMTTLKAQKLKQNKVKTWVKFTYITILEVLDIDQNIVDIFLSQL